MLMKTPHMVQEVCDSPVSLTQYLGKYIASTYHRQHAWSREGDLSGYVKVTDIKPLVSLTNASVYLTLLLIYNVMLYVTLIPSHRVKDYSVFGVK